jgi:hypothetical protein
MQEKLLRSPKKEFYLAMAKEQLIGMPLYVGINLLKPN